MFSSPFLQATWISGGHFVSSRNAKTKDKELPGDGNFGARESDATEIPISILDTSVYTSSARLEVKSVPAIPSVPSVFHVLCDEVRHRFTVRLGVVIRRAGRRQLRRYRRCDGRGQSRAFKCIVEIVFQDRSDPVFKVNLAGYQEKTLIVLWAVMVSPEDRSVVPVVDHFLGLAGALFALLPRIRLCVLGRGFFAGV